MSKNASAPRPTDAELAILRVLWERGPSTVRQVHEVIVGRVGPTAYTTALKLLQIMTEKGLVVATTRIARTSIRRVSARSRRSASWCGICWIVRSAAPLPSW
jgi:predicted transcriptional regulator